MAKTLVTGGTGFLGSHLVRQLVARGDVRLLVRERRDTSHIDVLDWEHAEGDVTDFNRLGWRPRPHEETLADTVDWQLEQLGPRARGHSLADAGLRASGAAAKLVPFGLAR